ncbi:MULTISPECIES: hypothetical protein [Pseudomonas]|jgi:hypothetical protein|uniref:hypothetical protein n=1 Tax=Pseudomonas TaxID=286 RepID=UPI000BA39D82|nr:MULTISPECIES: hypothetical protein [Pseudomonas]MCU1720692.1 hypothetical protein [Pseudomonas sp. 5P_5.1_Bac1]MCU1731509.1 hypothetical protein [Pseudomonas sp. 20P_3.2_Bac4]MCU1746572.1 hypothetical protein [Pseudomonas sp. 20P_3.2_Bac5]
MKRTVITGLFMSAALLASPVFAADDLCAANLQKIDDQAATLSTTSENLAKSVKEQTDDARAAQAAGNDKDCIALTTKALKDLEDSTKGGGNQ